MTDKEYALSENRGDEKRGKKLTKILCTAEIIGEIMMVLNLVIFTKGISYHKHINFALELALLIIAAVIISVFVLITIKANRIARVLAAAFIASTFFYNVMEFFLGLAFLGSENPLPHIPGFLWITAVCLIKILWVRNIFLQKDVRAYFFEVNKT